jgi:hypothetical protein
MLVLWALREGWWVVERKGERRRRRKGKEEWKEGSVSSNEGLGMGRKWREGMNEEKEVRGAIKEGTEEEEEEGKEQKGKKENRGPSTSPHSIGRQQVFHYRASAN